MVMKKVRLSPIRGSMWVIPCLLALSASDVSGENLFQQIGWKGATTGIIAAVLTALALIVLTLAAVYLRSRFKTHREQAEFSNRLFEENCEKAALLPYEVARLRRILGHEFVAHPHTVFQSAALFEHCIDAEVRLLLISAEDPGSLEEDDRILSGLRKKMGYGYLPLEHPLLSTRNLETGQGVSVFGPSGTTPLIHRATVVMNRETCFRLQYNCENEETVRIFPGQFIKLVFARHGDGVYGVQVEVAKTDSSSTIDCLHTLQFRRNQLRQFVRIEVNLPLKVRPLPRRERSGTAAESPSGCLEAKLCDISGGGLSFVYEKPLVPGDSVSLAFSLSTGSFSGVTGKILRVSVQEGKSVTSYRHHVQFVSIEQRQRDMIVKYIFEKQRQQNQIR